MRAHFDQDQEMPKFKIILGLLISIGTSFVYSSEESRPVTFYVNEFLMPGLQMTSANRTVEAVRKAIYPRQLKLIHVSIEDIDKAMSEGKADIAVVGSAIYWRHVRNGMRDIATLLTPEQPDPDRAVGGLIVANKGDKSISNLLSLKGKKLGINHPIGFQGYLTVKKEILDNGFNPDKFFKSVNVYGLDPKNRLEALKKGEIDAAVINVCYAEREKQKGNDLFKDFKPVALKSYPESKCLTSTELYPNWTFLVSPSLSPQTIASIANALYSMPAEPDGERWTIASDFRPAEELYRALKMGPYEYLNNWTLQRIWKEYRELAIVFILLILFAVWHYWRTQKLIALRTKDLREALAEQKRLSELAENINKRYENARRQFAVGQLSNLVAHELAQPLSGILLYCRGIVAILGKSSETSEVKDKVLQAVSKIVDRAKKSDEIVKLVRQYAKTDTESMSNVNLELVIDKVIEDLKKSSNLSDIAISVKKYASFTPIVHGNSIELELALINILRNSAEAVKESKEKKVEISLRKKGKLLILSVDDSGLGMDEEQLKKIEEPIQSLKKHGLGLGLSIVTAIVEKYGGSIRFCKSELNGLQVNISLPMEDTDA